MVGRDNFGVVIRVLDILSNEPVPMELLKRRQMASRAMCYVNEYSMKQKWRHLGRFDECVAVEMPVVFNGHPNYGWTVMEKKTETRISAVEVGYDELLAKGYIPRTLWLAENVEDYVFKGTELRWEWR